MRSRSRVSIARTSQEDPSMYPLQGEVYPITWTSLLLVFISLLVLHFPAQADGDHQHTSFVFDGFSGTNLILEADASLILSQSVLTLTNQTGFMLGRALYSIPVQMKSNETLSSFSTTFVFGMMPAPSDEGGHGMAFIFTPYTTLMGSMPAEYLGLVNDTSNGEQYNHLFAVEFDTVKSLDLNDPDDNHLGVDINSLISVKTEHAGYWNGADFDELNLKSGRNIQAWIDYDHLQSQLNVSITLVGSRPQKPLISQKIDLQNVMQEKMFVGFSAATGTLTQDHYVLAWSFTTQGTAPSLDISRLPSFGNSDPKRPGWRFIAGVTVTSLVLVLLVVAAVFIKRAPKYKETIEEWEQEYWPHRFTYKELSTATNGFRSENVLGEGGFGKVYRGKLQGSGQEIAVKCITREFTEGMKGFVAEISTMGCMQHRNLVQLRGWCRKHRQIFIVYEYMPNGSLDNLLFGNPATVLPWARRYKILKGVASGVKYLHEEWEKRVIHRDIKSSNVLLDSELNGRLGDFGLARLYDHGKNPDITRVTGTLGYMAPELTQTGKATPSSDVFSFGALLLEVACGRKPFDLSDFEQLNLVDWVWALFADGRLLDVVDPKLGNEYDAGEIEKVLKLGLLCSHAEVERRPGIRQVCQILEGEAPLPVIQTSIWLRFDRNVMSPSGRAVSGYPVTVDRNDKIME